MSYLHRSYLSGLFKRRFSFWPIYILSVIFVFHGLLVAYSNSTYIEQFVTPEIVSLLYFLGSSIAVMSFLFMNSVLHRIGNVKLALILALIEITALLLLGFSLGPSVTIIAFVVFLVLNPLLYLTLDVFSETLIGENEGSTGSRRGLALTLMSLAAVFAPLTLAFIVGDDESLLNRLYFTSAGIFSLFIILILARFRNFKDPDYDKTNGKKFLLKIWAHKNIRYVLLSHFTLQVFFSWTVIYIPLYLATKLHFEWSEIGVIIAVGLFAYVLFEYPIGILADKYFGEKEMMAIGFVILIISTANISLLTVASIPAWMLLMFLSRTGASLVEVTTESYFFKNIKGNNANIISLFRLTRPLALVFGSLLGTVSLVFLPLSHIFLILAVVMLPTLFCINQLVDTK